jgi:DNA-binding transcriptional LysR family regulator
MRATAAALAVSPTVISRHVANLEKRLGAWLIERKGRSIALTDAGARFRAQIAGAFDTFDLIGAAAKELVKPHRPAAASAVVLAGAGGHALVAASARIGAAITNFSIHLHPTLARSDLNAAKRTPRSIIASTTQLRGPASLKSNWQLPGSCLSSAESSRTGRHGVPRI